MAYSRTLLLGAALGFSLAMPVVAQDAPDVTADTVLATVNGDAITLGHVIAMREMLEDQQKALPAEVLFEGLLERLIQQRAVVAAVDEIGKGTELAIENERSALIANRKVMQLAEAITIDDTDLQAAYDAKYAEFEPIKEFNASHILVATEDDANAVIEELEGGADFAELAAEKSTGPSAGNGGSLGWFAPGTMVPAFEEVAMAMDVGAVSEPVETQFGWHVIKLNETRLPEAPALDDVRADLQQALWETRLREEVEALVNDAEIDRPDLSGIDPAVIGDTSLVED